MCYIQLLLYGACSCCVTTWHKLVVDFIVIDSHCCAQVMLETEQEETKEKEMEEKRRLAEQRQQVAEQQLTEYLFGTPGQ